MSAHILTVPADGNPAGFVVACAELTDDCEGWVECISDCDADALDAADEDGDDSPTLHGEIHKRMDGGWCTRTGQCWIAGHPDTCDAARDLGLPPGEHPVRAAYGDHLDWGMLELVAIAPAVKA